MNSRERFIAALSGEKPDRTPLAHVSALTTIELQEATRCFMPDVHDNPEQLVQLCAANHYVLGFDAVTFIINYFNEPAALGCGMRWGSRKELPMYASRPWAGPEDAVIPKDLLDRKPVSTYLQALRVAKKKHGDKMAVLGKIMGPFSMTQVMYGVENTMTGLIESPEKIKHFLDVSADILIRCARAQFEAGIDAIAIGEGGAGSNMLSPDMHREFLLDIHRKMIREIPGQAIMHICGNILPRLGLLAETGLSCFNFDWAVKPEIMKSACGGNFRIMGNINTSDLLGGKPADIKKQVVENLEAGVDIISPGCAVSPECPNSNFQAMLDAVKGWKR